MKSPPVAARRADRVQPQLLPGAGRRVGPVAGEGPLGGAGVPPRGRPVAARSAARPGQPARGPGHHLGDRPRQGLPLRSRTRADARRRCTREACDVRLGSESLHFAFKFLWGGQTLSINGRFQERDRDSRRPLFDYFDMAGSRNAGRVVTWRSLPADLGRRLGRVAPLSKLGKHRRRLARGIQGRKLVAVLTCATATCGPRATPPAAADPGAGAVGVLRQPPVRRLVLRRPRRGRRDPARVDVAAHAPRCSSAGPS